MRIWVGYVDCVHYGGVSWECYGDGEGERWIYIYDGYCMRELNAELEYIAALMNTSS